MEEPDEEGWQFCWACGTNFGPDYGLKREEHGFDKGPPAENDAGIDRNGVEYVYNNGIWKTVSDAN
jgi:hypothetical protein